VHTEHETLGDIIKSARQKADITIEELRTELILPNDICTGSKTKAETQL